MMISRETCLLQLAAVCRPTVQWKTGNMESDVTSY